MARRRRIPIPLLIVGLAGVLGAVVLSREPAAERITGFSATTPLEEPVHGLQAARPWIDRVLEETPVRYTLRTAVFDIVGDRGVPPRTLLLAFRSTANDRDFTMQFDNGALGLVVSQAFPTPTRMRTLPPPESIDLDAVRVGIAEALATADAVMRERPGGGPDPSPDGGGVEDGVRVEVDAVLRSGEGRPEWRISYARTDGEAPVGLGTVVIDGVEGTVRAVRAPAGSGPVPSASEPGRPVADSGSKTPR